MRGCKCMLVFEDTETRHAFYHRSGVRCTRGHHEGGNVFEVRVVLFFSGLGETCITVFEDNEGARYLAQNPVCTSKSTHIDVRHPFLREIVFRGEFAIVHVVYKEHHAGFLTTTLTREVFCFHRDFLMNI